MTHLITGITGIVGSRIAFELLAKGEQVRGFCRESSDKEWVRRYFQFLNPKGDYWFDSIEWAHGDVTDILSLQEAMHGIESVFHCAAVVSFHPRDHKMLHKINVEGTANVCNAAIASKVKALCHISSTAAIGRSRPGEQITEDSEWRDSSLNSSYAISKRQAENEVWRAQEEGLNVVIVNPSVILGAGPFDKSSATIFARVQDGLKFYPTGSNAFVAVKDVAQCAIELTKRGHFGQRYLISGNNVSYREMFTSVAHSLNKKEPSVEAKTWMLKTGLVFERLKELLTGKKAMLTRESVRNANNLVAYDSSRLLSTLDFTFTSLEDSTQEVAGYFLENAS